MPSLLLEVVIVVGPLFAISLLLDYKMNSYCSDISVNDLKSSESSINDLPFVNSTPSPIGAKKQKIIHVITGGSGFIGSWIARYLLIRGDSDIYVIDCDPLPRDLQRHGIHYLNIDLIANDSADRQKLQTFLSDNVDKQIIIFHCAVTGMFNPRKRASRVDEPKDNIKIASTLVDCCLPFESNVSIINIGDALCVRKNTSWYNPFAIGSWKHVCEGDQNNISDRKRSSYINDYAYSKAKSESIILKSPIRSFSLRPQGFVTGHLGDSFLTPALQYNGGLLHSQGVPISLLHVEDIVRACLLLEKRILETSRRDDEDNSKIYTISSPEMTNLLAMYNYISGRRPFRKIKIQPIIVLTVSHIISINNSLIKLITRKPVGITEKEDALLCGIAKSLTPARFNVLQTTQRPMIEDQRILESELYGFKLQYSIRDILDGILEEERMINEKRRGSKTK